MNQQETHCMLEINNHFYLNFLVGGIDNNLYKPQIDTPFMLVQKSMLLELTVYYILQAVN